MQFIDPLGLNGWQALQEHLNQPGNQSALSKAMYENTKGTKPVSLRSDGHPQGYGCGDESTDRYVPDGLYGVSFLPACRIHDKCYEEPGKSKAYCDTQLGNNIRSACDRVWKNIPTADAGEMLSKCYLAASLYQVAVEQAGEGAYNAAQKEATREPVFK